MPRDLTVYGDAEKMVEDAREEFMSESLVANILMGKPKFRLAFPFPVLADEAEDRRKGDEYLATLIPALQRDIDPELIEREAKTPLGYLHWLGKMGCLALKIPVEYGGLGFSHTNFSRVLSAMASHSASFGLLVSVQAMGVPSPLAIVEEWEKSSKRKATAEELQRSAAQRAKYLPRLAKGAICAFALTEQLVGSDAAQVKITATPVDGGSAYVLNGQKLFITNTPIADHFIVIARVPGKDPKRELTAFFVDRSMEGFDTSARLQFMGLRGLENGVPVFHNVRVPAENMVGRVGEGFKIAMSILNGGRISIGALCLGMAKQSSRMARWWCMKRVQMGSPIGEYALTREKIRAMEADIFAMQAMVEYTSRLADMGGVDYRLEAAICKLFSSEALWRIADDTFQIRGGRAFETAVSQKRRGETALPVERTLRDARLMLIGEGTSEIMRLFIMGEAADVHMKRYERMSDPEKNLVDKLRAGLDVAREYAAWYPSLWVPGIDVAIPEYAGPLARHLRYARGTSARLARTTMHYTTREVVRLRSIKEGLVSMKQQQVLLKYFVNITMHLYAMTVACSYALAHGSEAHLELAESFCALSRARIEEEFLHISQYDREIVYIKQTSDAAYRGEFAGILENEIVPVALDTGTPY